MRTLIAWDPNDLQRVVRIMADGGSSSANPTGPDVMAHLPVGLSSASAHPDTSAGGPALVYPGFLGEYFVRNEGLWFAVSGKQSNALLAHGGACTADTMAVDWAHFTCERATIQFSFSMHVVPAHILFLGSYTGPERPPHDLAMSTTTIAGVHLTFGAWAPPPPPDSDSTFVIDTTITDTTSTGELRASVFAAPDTTTPGEVLTVFTVSNPNARSVTLTFPSGQTYDISAYDAAGTLVWSSSMGVLFTQGSQTVTLPAYGALVYSAHWPAAGKHGTFTIVGRLMSSNHPLQASTSLHLP
ncbi:MAG: hypothetical protein IRY91_17840 [Gemmatimonadaceae bacterium]|nr:hypothetical protein [Gemmatimonadaceae bacterium]